MAHHAAAVRPRGALRARSLWVAAVVAASLVAVGTAAVAGASSIVGPSVRVAPPTDAAKAPDATLSGVSCSSGSSCIAVGGYYNASTNGLPMAASGTGTSWSRSVAIALPKNHATSLSASTLTSVACPGPTTCVAVGDYEDTTPSVLPIEATESAGKWSTAVALKLPAAAGGNQLSQLTSVACTAVGSCVAVGSFSDKKSQPALMVVTETSGTWGAAVQVALPGDAGTVQRSLGNVELSSVWCSDTSDCVAVGSYLNRAGSIVPLRVTESGGSWGAAVRIALPAHTPAVGSAELYAVSCRAAATCVAVGYFTNAGQRIAPMEQTETAGKWGAIVALGLPAMTPGATGGVLAGIACTTSGTCTAVGDLTLTGGQTVPAVDVDLSGHWQGLQRVTSVAPGIAKPKIALLHAVTCPTSNRCIGAGSVYAVSAKGFVVNAEAMATPIVPVRPVVDPAPPSAVTASPRPHSALVTWHPGDDGGAAITSYTATASPGGRSCTSAVAACSITGLVNGTKYAVTVTATNSHGTSTPSSPSAPVVPGVPPTAPTGVQITVGHLHASVRWHAATASPGDPVTRYLVSAVPANGPARTCSTASLSCSVTGLTAGGRYTVTVVAQNAVGRSPRSAPRQFRAT